MKKATPQSIIPTPSTSPPSPPRWIPEKWAVERFPWLWPVYSFRAEAQCDVIRLLHLLDVEHDQRFDVERWQLADMFGGDVEIRAQIELEELRALMRRVPDGHVMLQTLHDIPLRHNTLERNRDLR